MPGFDGAGPLGQGSGTGRRRGNCGQVQGFGSGAPAPWGWGQGGGLGRGRGRGRRARNMAAWRFGSGQGLEGDMKPEPGSALLARLDSLEERLRRLEPGSTVNTPE